jgi:hypothetical protein
MTAKKTQRKKPRRRNAPWDVEFIKRTSAWQSPIAEECVAFAEHQTTLLDKLRNGYERGTKSKPFEAVNSWLELTRLAKLYFSGRRTAQEVMSNADCAKRLRELARALRHARNLVDRAMEDDVGADLFRGWLDSQNIKDALINWDGNGKLPSSLASAPDGIKAAVEGLAALDAAVRKAVATTDKLSQTGRPVLLPRDLIQGLARVYRSSTGTIPGRGDGPFADFAHEFMTAVGQTTFEHRSLIDAIQDAHRLFSPSWFDEET